MEINNCGLEIKIGEPVKTILGSELELTYSCNKCEVLITRNIPFDIPASRLKKYLDDKESMLYTMIRDASVKTYLDSCTKQGCS
ncbi:MAG: hypothetical protein PHQ59_03795 [Candidatus Daviesbacteria bacterium]|nr:hypothetical protein [Candidatus Daviesbacteria bacterium]